MTTHLQEVRLKVIDAVPESRHRSYYGGQDSLRLADVLGAITRKCRIENNPTDRGEFGFYTKDDEMYWNLAKNLDEQSPETIEFLHKILV